MLRVHIRMLISIAAILGCWGAEDAAAAEYRFYHPDMLGSNVLVTDRNGELVQRTVNTPYGELHSMVNASGQSIDPAANTVRHVFTGEEQDPESDLHYLNARYYDPFVGRMLSVDPDLIRANAGRSFRTLSGEPGNFNGFAYVRNRPTRLIDPTGTSAVDIRVTEPEEPALENMEMQDTKGIPELTGPETDGDRSFINVVGDPTEVIEAMRALSKSKTASKLLERLEELGIGIEIHVDKGGEGSAAENKNDDFFRIRFDPTQGHRTEDGEIIPPFVILGHELAHNPADALGKGARDPKLLPAQLRKHFRNLEEHRVHRTFDVPVAQELGLPSRRGNNTGEGVSVSCVTCTK